MINHTRNSVFLTGKAGTGKSTFLKYLTATTRKKYVVLAPTGIAAVNASGQTLHSFFHLPFKPVLPDDPDVATAQRLRKRFKYTKAQLKLIKALDLIIIDEVSMVRADVIDLVDRILRVYCNYRLPFGGKQLLLVGDVFQLEPVIRSDERDILSRSYLNGMFFFNAHAFEQLHLVPIELQKVFRQRDDAFIRLLDRVRAGKPLGSDIQALNKRVGVLPSGKMTMTIATRRKIVDSINEHELSLLKNAPRTFEGLIKGDFPDDALPTDKTLVLKIGAQVVFIRNDIAMPAASDGPTQRRWVNGTLGKVVDFGDGTVVVELDDGTRHSVEPEVWENVKYTYNEEKRQVEEEVLGSFAQYPLKAAWALTIHKSQGLTFDNVCIDLSGGAFSGGQTYVALSRCRSLEGITMRTEVSGRDIFVNPAVVRFSETFNDTTLIDSAIASAEADADYAAAAKAFDSGDFVTASERFCHGATARNELHRPEVARLISCKLNIIKHLRDENERLLSIIDSQKKMLAKLAVEYVEMAEQCRTEGWDMNAALANCDKAVAISPDYNLAHIARGKVQVAMERYDEAIQSFRTAMSLDPADWRAPLEGGKLAADTGDIADALDFLLIAERNGRQQPAVHEALADAYSRSGDEHNAVRHRRIAQKLRAQRNK